MHVLGSSVQGDPEAKDWQVGVLQGKDLQGNSGESFRMGTGDAWLQFGVFRASLEPRGIP